MKRIVQSSLSGRLRSSLSYPTIRCLQTTSSHPATVGGITASGPPPTVPTPSAQHVDSRVARRRKQAEMLKKGQDMRAIESGAGGGTAKMKRFWKDVHVVHTEGGLQIHLDKRPIRRPNKAILTVPHSKPHLASAIALEWDLLTSASQALKHHLIPLTSLVSRALDIVDADAERSSATTTSANSLRTSITDTLLRYLDTDSLLCYSPPPPPITPGYETHSSRTNRSLRSIQEAAARPIIQYLTSRVWPGIEIHPVLDADSIMPKPQPQITRDVIRGWVSGLPPFELAGLERAVLAGKGLLGAARLVVEWSPEFASIRQTAPSSALADELEADSPTPGTQPGTSHPPADPERPTTRVFGVEEAARTASLEVDWQIGMWGAVEDTHDVEREDIRRQLGSVVLLVSGV